MAREKFLFLIGIFTMIVPNLGFSEMIEKIIFLVFGALLVLISYNIYFDKRRQKKRTPKHEADSLQA